MSDNIKHPYCALVPRVKKVEHLSGAFAFTDGLDWHCTGSSICVERIGWLLSEHGFSRYPGDCCSSSLQFEVQPDLGGAQAYEIVIKPDGIHVRGGDDAALYYGALTLFQLATICRNILPCCHISDQPSFPVRGVMLDISRNKVPTMATLFRLVDKLSQLKINHLQLYMEHSFAYSVHKAVWQDSSPMTAEELIALDRYCRERFIELVPNQNSFGHMERWLSHPEYNAMAAHPDGGAPLPWGGVQSRPTSLNPLDPLCIDFLDGLYTELLPCFSSTLFNVGCDEVFGLSISRCADEVKRCGEGRIYLDFLKKIFSLVRQHGKRPAFWGDIIVKYPGLVSEIPLDALALEWGYEADHPFDEHAALFRGSSLDFYVCPGTSSWRSVGGRFDNMRLNINNAAEMGVKHGAKGVVVTDWGDAGHWQPLCVSYAGFVHGAAASWGPMENRDLKSAEAISACFIGGGAEYGEILIALAELYKNAGALCSNSSVLFNILFNEEYAVPEGVSVLTLCAVDKRLQELEKKLNSTSPDGRESEIVYQEAALIIHVLRAACVRGKALLDGSSESPLYIARWKRITAECIEEQRRVWLLRNRAGGLEDTLSRWVGFCC